MIVDQELETLFKFRTVSITFVKDVNEQVDEIRHGGLERASGGTRRRLVGGNDTACSRGGRRRRRRRIGHG